MLDDLIGLDGSAQRMPRAELVAIVNGLGASPYVDAPTARLELEHRDALNIWH